MNSAIKANLLVLQEALEASWDSSTSYLGVLEAGNPALGQCYPTSRVVQHFFPAAEIVEGEVWTGKSVEKHFWNVLVVEDEEYHIDLSWQQFPPGSSVRKYRIRERQSLGDRQITAERCNLLRDRVTAYLSRRHFDIMST
jgi:hypothetical protein